MTKPLLILTGDDDLAERVADLAGTHDMQCKRVGEVDALADHLSRQPRAGLVWDLRNGFGTDAETAHAVLAGRRRARNPLIALTDGFVRVQMAAPVDRASAVWLDRSHVIDRPRETARILRDAMSNRMIPRSNDEFVLEAAGLRFASFSPALRETVDRVTRVAPYDVPLLITGETGTGKTTLARIVHHLSPRTDGPFQNLACGAIPPELIESELFGHIRGAFTGAERDRVGRFEAADAGTLLLDEIDVLGVNEQVKLLRVLETGEYERVGESKTQRSRARLIVASNLDLKELTRTGRFRSDLFYRLNTLEFRLPPLRERPEDVVPLAMQFVQQACERTGMVIELVHREFLEVLKAYQWPGNVRELKNQIERAVLLCDRGRLTVRDLNPDLLAAARANPANDPRAGRAPLAERIADMERRILEQELVRHNHCRTSTAKALGISRVGLYKKLRKYEMM